jgi:hypothetical protein
VCAGGGAHVQEVLVYFLEGTLSENGASVMGQSSADWAERLTCLMKYPTSLRPRNMNLENEVG